MSPVSSAEYYEMSYTITRLLSESVDSDRSMAVILEMLGSKLGWDLGSLWLVDDAKLVLRCRHFWHRTGAKEAPNFDKVSRAREYSVDEGMPGRLWAQKRPVWIEDVTAEENFPRASVAKMDGVRTGAGFPLHVPSGVLGVIEFFSFQKLPPDANMLQFFPGLGMQIGVFLERARALADLKQVDAQFRLLADTSSDAVLTIDSDSTIVFASSAVERVFGYTPAEVVGKKMTMLMPQRFRPRHEAGILRYLTTGKRKIPWEGVELRGLRKDGSEVPLLIAFGEFFRGHKRIFTGFAREIATKTGVVGR